MVTFDDIRAMMQKKSVDAYVVTHNNRFIGQDILDSENKIKCESTPIYW